MEGVEEFRKRIMRTAYLDFLSWACSNDEIIQEFHEQNGKSAAEDFESFRKYVTELYWGDEPDEE